MQIDVGYFYFIKDSFFDIMDAQECLAKFDVIAEKFYENSSRINMDIPTIPYR